MKKTKIEALILDYGGVISHSQNPDNVKNILQILKQDGYDFRKVYQDTRANYDNGQLSGEEYWHNILRYYGVNANDTEISQLIEEDVKSWTQVNDAMIELIKEIKGKVQKLAFISNMTQDTLVFMKERFNWLDQFDELVFSCEEGINKPDVRIYEACLMRLDISAQDSLFVDDSEENIVGAMKTGMNVIHFKSFTQFCQELDRKFYFNNKHIL